MASDLLLQVVAQERARQTTHKDRNRNNSPTDPGHPQLVSKIVEGWGSGRHCITTYRRVDDSEFVVHVQGDRSWIEETKPRRPNA